MIVDGSSTRFLQPDYSWRKDNAPPLPKDLMPDDPTPTPAARSTPGAAVQGQPEKPAKQVGFFKVNHRIFSSGFAAQVGTRPLAFYFWLLAAANEAGQWTFAAPDDKVAREARISPTSLKNYRAILKTHGLIDYSRGTSQAYRYTVTDSLALDLDRKPKQEKPRKIGKPRGRSIAKQGKPKEDKYDGLPSIMFEGVTKYAIPATTNFAVSMRRAPQILRNCAGSS